MPKNKLNYYLPVLDGQGIVYSIDKVRYKIKVCAPYTYHDKDKKPHEVNPVEQFNAWIMRVDTFGEVEIKYYPSFSRGYRHLWVLKFPEDDSTVSLGLGIGDKKEDLRIGFVEYNPNKVHSSAFLKWLGELRSFLDTFELVRWDLACDFLCQRSLCRLDMNGLRSYELHYENGTYTEYTGVRNKPGRTKLYDKRAESDLDYDLTRVEFTLARVPEWSALPKVLLSPEQMTLGLCDSDLKGMMSALVSVLLTVDAPMRNRSLKDLGYRTRKKIEPYLAETTLQLDFSCMNDLLARLLHDEI